VEDRPADPLPGDEILGEDPPFTSPFRASRPVSDLAVATGKVAAIVEAAERAAEEIRLQTEERARERIAEAERAAQLRVDAAETEARELLAAARREAEALRATAAASVAQTREEAQAARAATLQASGDEAARLLADAEAKARDLLSEARQAARQVLTEGTELSGHLGELSESLRRNAERLEPKQWSRLDTVRPRDLHGMQEVRGSSPLGSTTGKALHSAGLSS